jgi:hypothetical protein
MRELTIQNNTQNIDAAEGRQRMETENIQTF